MDTARSFETDDILIQRAKEQIAEFGDLYERYADRIYGYVLNRVGNRLEAEDVTAKVFVQALTHLSRYTDQGVPFSAWLYRIAHNLVANWHRDGGRFHSFLESLQPPEVDFSIERIELIGQLRKAVAALPLEKQRLIALKFVEGLPNAEIGRMMGRSEGAVKALLHRTLGALRGALSAADEVSG